MMLDRRPAHYGLEANHVCDLLHAGIVRVLDRTQWHNHAGPSLADLAFSSSETLYEAVVQLSAQGRIGNSERCRGTFAFRLVARAAEAVAG